MITNSYFFLSFWTLFTIVNPLGALGPFLAMTEKNTLVKKREIAFRASCLMAGVLLFFTVVGSFFFQIFGFTVPALKIAGGILLLLVSIDMLNVRRSRFKGTEEEELEGQLKDDIAVFPLAVPLLSGPGAIASVLMLTDKASTVADYVTLVLSIALTTAIVFYILREGERVAKLLGKIGINILSRLMGLVLASMAVQFILDGIRMAFPTLSHLPPA
jgi:multiple antibiotic resistance protein